MKILMLTALILIGMALPGPADANHSSNALLPDLAMLQPTESRLERSGGSRLLRFSTVIVNLGPGLFDVYGSNPDPADATRLTSVTQRLQQSGAWVEHPDRKGDIPNFLPCPMNRCYGGRPCHGRRALRSEVFATT
jgi:hypothetical protein